MSRRRDSQRSAVYDWERALDGVEMFREMMTLDEVGEMVKKVWRSERGRYGLANTRDLEIRRVHWGQSRALAFGASVSYPKWARNPWVVLHEIAHCLNRRAEGQASHGPRFVGILIGLACRHMGLDRDHLVRAAEEMGVKVNLIAIGATPRYGWHKRAVDALVRLGGRAANDVELAFEMQVGYRAARGACLTLIRDGVVRRRGRAIVLTTFTKGEGK